jgi:hypothetical protein
MIARARRALRTIAPELEYAPLELRLLDGPHDAPRYAVAVGHCYNVGACPHHVADPGACTVPSCELRRSLRLLFDGSGALIQVLDGHRRWSPGLPDDQSV